jgi:hypothetical protein
MLRTYQASDRTIRSNQAINLTQRRKGAKVRIKAYDWWLGNFCLAKVLMAASAPAKPRSVVRTRGTIADKMKQQHPGSQHQLPVQIPGLQCCLPGLKVNSYNHDWKSFFFTFAPLRLCVRFSLCSRREAVVYCRKLTKRAPWAPHEACLHTHWGSLHDRLGQRAGQFRR